MDPRVDPEQIERFVAAVFRYADEGTWLSLRVFDEHRRDVPPVIETIRTNGDMGKIAAAAVRVARLAARRGRPSVFAPPVATFTNAEHAREQDIACALVGTAEIDHGAEAGVARLRGLLGPPTVVVESGGTWLDDAGRPRPKLHGHWRYSEAAVGDDVALSKRLRVAMAALVDADPTNGPDSHPIRWPGSVHRKAEPRQARILELNDGAEIHLAEAVETIEAACRAANIPLFRRPSVRTEAVIPGVVDPLKIMALRENSPEFRRAWGEGYKDQAGVPDHSKCDWWMALEACRAGWSDEEIAALVSAFRARVGEADQATAAYLGHTIGKARHSLKSGRTVVDDGLYAAERSIERGDNGGAVRALGARLGIPLSKVIITGIDTAVAYWLVLEDGRRVGLGDAGAFLSQAKVRQRVLAAADVLMDTVKQREWDVAVRMLLTVAQREEAADSDPVKALAEAIADYLDRHRPAPWDDEDTDTTFAANKPVERGGKPWLNVRHFLPWANVRGGLPELRERELHTLLRQAGWGGERFVRRVGPKPVGRYYWGRALDDGDDGITGITENLGNSNG